MTTNPRASIFRLGRSAPAQVESEAQDAAKAAETAKASTAVSDSNMVQSQEDGFGNRVFPTAAGEDKPKAAAADASAPEEISIEQEILAIKAEGLTGRQLRMARRVAHRHGIVSTSDHDAVRQLRKKGLDPFKHGNMLELVVGSAEELRDDSKTEAAVKLPQTVPKKAAIVPAVDFDAENRRAREIIHVQVAIARRRKRKLFFLFARLAAFILLPTFLAGHYFYNVATSMYATKSEFVIQQAQPASSGGMGGLFSGTAMATAQDSMTVQSYLQSREAMLRLESAHGFRNYFSDPTIDPLQRLEPNASNEATYKVYRRNVKIGFDPTEGIVKMEVSAPDPAVSAMYSRVLISYAEEQVDQLTQRLREDQMSGAMDNYKDAENNVREAQQRVVDLQEQRGIFSAQAEANSMFGQISSLENQLLKERLDLREHMENQNPNATRVAAIERNISRFQTMIAELRSQMTDSSTNSQSLARITGELMMAESELETRRMMLAKSLEQLESARIEANRQVRYLSTGVKPIPPDRPTYPRAFENTAVSFLILAGIYLLLSITFTVLREQVSA